MNPDKNKQDRVLKLEKKIDRLKLQVAKKTIQQKNRKAWEKTFDAIDDWICIIDLESNILRSNRAVEKCFQIRVQDAIGQKCCKLAHGTETQIDTCPFPRMLISRKRESAEIEIRDDRWMMITVDPIFNGAGEMLSAVHIARDITQMMMIRKERERLVKDLKKALIQIKTLSGLLPICSYCKKIRDDKGYWSLLESYIESHSEVSFSHGLCPDCSEELYGDQEWYIEMKKAKGKK